MKNVKCPYCSHTQTPKKKYNIILCKQCGNYYPKEENKIEE